MKGLKNMSYSCSISFKKMEASEIIPFLREIKKTCCEKIEEIAKENYLWCPFIRKHLYTPEKFSAIPSEEMIESEAWTKSLFTFRYFYLDEMSLLGIFGVPSCIEPMFDKTVYFQNSCDQDYERSEWEGIGAFENIYDKYDKMSVEKLLEKDEDAKESYEDNPTSERLGYWKRSLAYKEIWSHIENYLWDDSTSIYFSLFGFYNLFEIQKFLKMCYDNSNHNP